jgi:2-polyprenyl-3-methyl-5-hydroxy-6-metoxy-1,4-benzoquinol methylase
MKWLYYTSYRVLPLSNRLLIGFNSILRALFSGIWLGLLSRHALLEIDTAYYSTTKKYSDKSYNKSGLQCWEKAIIRRYFQNCKRLLLVGAGGGREILALGRLGYEVRGFECNRELVQVANKLLEEEGLCSRVEFAPADTCHDSQAFFDGLIIGWGAYMLIQGRAKRVVLLKSMRAQVRSGAPIFLSFFFRSPNAKRFFVTLTIGNTLRRIMGREKIELGDALEPECVHYFTQEEIAAELQQGGFLIDFYSEQPYGHAVGIAS